MKWYYYLIIIVTLIGLSMLTGHLLTKCSSCDPIVIHTDTYKAKYEAANARIYAQYIKIDSLKRLQKQKYIIVYETTNDSIPANNIPKSFRDLAEYLNK